MAEPASNWAGIKPRLVTAALLIAGVLLAMFYAPLEVWIVCVVICMAVGAWEWAGLLGYSSGYRRLFAGLTALAGLLLALFGAFVHPLPYALAALFWAVLVPIWLKSGWSLPGMLMGAAIGWLLLLPTLLALLYLRGESPALLLAAIALAAVADSAAYFAGRAFGRHKMAPGISPGKTWEGAAGGALAVALYAWTLASFWAPEQVVQTVAAGLLLFVLSVLGDLFESWIKRRAGVKDSGRLLPGHGGVLDRIDSHLAVLPAAALIWMLMK